METERTARECGCAQGVFLPGGRYHIPILQLSLRAILRVLEIISALDRFCPTPLIMVLAKDRNN